LLSFFVVLSLVDVLVYEFNLSSQVVISFSHSLYISVRLEYLRLSVIDLSLGGLNLIVDLDTLLLPVLDGLLEAINFPFMVVDCLVLGC